MNNEDVLQRNDAGELEIRTAPSTGDTGTNKDDVYTRDEQGRLCVRTTGGGGGGGTGTVTSVNGVQPVAGNVEITGDNITATVGEEEATITQHLTTLKNDESGLAEQVQTNQSDINTLKNQQYPYPEDSEFTVVTVPQTASPDLYRLKLSASVDENATTAIPDGIYGYYAYFKVEYLQSEDSWTEYGKTYAFIKFSVKGGKFSEGEFGGMGLSFVPYIPKQFFTATTAESQQTTNGSGALANISLDQIAASIIDNKIILAPDIANDGVFGSGTAGGTDIHLAAGFTPIRNLETGAELVTSGEFVTNIDWETQQILYGTQSPYKTSVLTDTSLQGAGTTESPLGISTETMATINGKQDALTAEQLAAVNSGITSAKVASYDAYAGEISTAQSTADKADGAAEVAQQTANLAGQNAAQALTQLAGKANTADLPQNQTGTTGQVYTKTADGAEWADAAGGTTVSTVDSVVIEDLGNGYIRMHGKLTEPTITAGGFAQTPVVFPTGYTMANANYSIQLTGSSAEQTADVNVDFDTPATTGFNVDMKNLNATTAATNVVVHWTVFGQKPA